MKPVESAEKTAINQGFATFELKASVKVHTRFELRNIISTIFKDLWKSMKEWWFFVYGPLIYVKGV